MDAEWPPTGLPVLQKGRHMSPEDGACLMEYVSVLAGESFSDHPRCVHPLLVRLAWRINDLTGDEIRSQLPDLAPRLVGTAVDNRLVAPAVVAACCRYGRAHASPVDSSLLARAEHRAEARLRRLRGRPEGRGRLGDRLYRERAHFPLHEASRALAEADPDALPQLLQVALGAVERVVGTSAERASSRQQSTARVG